MSGNLVDLVFYFEVEGCAREDLDELLGDHHHRWTEEGRRVYAHEYESRTRCIVSTNLSSISLDSFGPGDDWEDSDLVDCQADLSEIGLTTIDYGMHLVAWYDGADRPVPDRWK